MRLAEPPTSHELVRSAWRAGAPAAQPNAPRTVRSVSWQQSWWLGRRRRPPTASACRTRPWSTTWRTRGPGWARRPLHSSCGSWPRAFRNTHWAATDGW